MKRTQIQIPDPLYDEVRRVATARDWSVSEVVRRAVEQYVAETGVAPDEQAWRPPEPRSLGRPTVPEEEWRDLLGDDEEGSRAHLH
jgi:predicted transcriptional regulator